MNELKTKRHEEMSAASNPVLEPAQTNDPSELDRMAQAARASNARLAAIVDSAMDADQRIIIYNPAAEKMFGWSRAEMLGQPLDILLPPRFRQAHRESILRFGRTGMTNRRLGALGAIHGLRSDGKEFPMEASISQVDEPGQKIYTVILREITQRVQAEQELEKLYAKLEGRVLERTKQLEAANKELEAFSYSVSHDLHAPLRHIGGYVELLQKHADALDDTSRRYLNIIAQATVRMGNLIDDLLAFSRVGRIELNPVQVDMRAVVQRVIDEQAQEIRGREVEWAIGALPRVYADAALLEVVWTNLISNALKYTRPRARAEIEIGYAHKDGQAFFFIRDNGVGFEMEYVDKIFAGFQRLHSASEFEGTGIGLANAQRIIQRHGGRIWIQGAVDKGATVYFSLPQNEE